MSTIQKLATLVFTLAVVAMPAHEAFAASCKDTPLGERPDDAAALAAACTDTAVNAPYKLAWLLLAKICPLDKTCPPGSKDDEDCRCAWQDWATNNQTFPIHPQPVDPPKWPASGKWPLDDGDELEFHCQSPADEIVFERRRNRPEFEYVVDNKLWYQEGLKEAYNKEGWQIDFPQNAVDVAVAWKEISEEEKSRYHWKTLPNGKTCGLTNLDVKSKILPKWLFFSFEHVDNPGRCDFTGCRDDFGQDPPFVPPIFKHPTHMYFPGKLNERPVYEPGTLDPRLTTLIKLSGMWKDNYRLKGIQADFTTADGKPTIFAGSQIEGTAFPASSSCMTCHSQAGFDSNGQNQRGGGEVGDFLSPNGVPDPAWFYDTGPDGWQLRYKQADFVWAIPINACPIACPASQAELELVPDRCNCG